MSLPDTVPKKADSGAYCSEGMFTVKAAFATILPNVYVTFLSDTATQGGLEQLIPAQEAVIMFGLPSAS
jgi:hypothetical protein